MKTFQDVFKTPKPIIGVLHLKGASDEDVKERAKREVAAYLEGGVDALLAEGLGANMIRFETGTVFKEGQTGMEHMASFNYAYKLTAVRDWLFEQVKA